MPDCHTRLSDEIYTLPVGMGAAGVHLLAAVSPVTLRGTESGWRSSAGLQGPPAGLSASKPAVGAFDPLCCGYALRASHGWRCKRQGGCAPAHRAQNTTAAVGASGFCVWRDRDRVLLVTPAYHTTHDLFKKSWATSQASRPSPSPPSTAGSSWCMMGGAPVVPPVPLRQLVRGDSDGPPGPLRSPSRADGREQILTERVVAGRDGPVAGQRGGGALEGWRRACLLFEVFRFPITRSG